MKNYLSKDFIIIIAKQIAISALLSLFIFGIGDLVFFHSLVVFITTFCILMIYQSIKYFDINLKFYHCFLISVTGPFLFLWLENMTNTSHTGGDDAMGRFIYDLIGFFFYLIVSIILAIRLYKFSKRDRIMIFEK